MPSSHILGAPGMQVPPWQLSPTVQPSPSSQGVSSGATPATQPPVAASQTWPSQGLAVSQTTGWPMQEPPWQVSLVLHRVPSSHAVPCVAAVVAHAPVAPSQASTSSKAPLPHLWQALTSKRQSFVQSSAPS